MNYIPIYQSCSFQECKAHIQCIEQQSLHVIIFFHIQCCNTLIRCVSFPTERYYSSYCLLSNNYLAWPSKGLSLYVDPDLAAWVAKKYGTTSARILFEQCSYILSC